MSNKTCKSCAFWTKYSDRNLIDRGLFAGKCKNPNLNYDETGYDKVPDNGLLYCDSNNYEGYPNGFYTGKNFGCIHWSANEQ